VHTPHGKEKRDLSYINMQLVREFFELNLFYVLPYWRYETAMGDHDYSASQLFVQQNEPPHSFELKPELGAGDVKGIKRAVVEVRAWHGDRLYSSMITPGSVFSRVASTQTCYLAESIFDGGRYKIILVVSRLSSTPEKRAEAIHKLQELGVDHVLEFPTMLADMIRLVSGQGNYSDSPSLQTIRLLKQYDFIRGRQMEFYFPSTRSDDSFIHDFTDPEDKDDDR